MSDTNTSVCAAAPTLIFACSGAADVGAVSDRAARELTAKGSGKMYCLAGIGGRVPGILKTTSEAERILAIDGCPLDCVRLCLEHAGFGDFEHMRVTDLGLAKGSSPATEENIAAVMAAAEARLSG